ncbi:MAG: hypothetical protein L0216_14105 [Planctomycetales bacterium]|nr:hypothetical protein [Planctomycetales bacterium]
MRPGPFTLAAALVAGMACSSTENRGPAWAPRPVGDVLEEARAEGRLLALLLFEPGTAYQRVESETLSDPRVEAALEEFVFHKVDLTLAPNEARWRKTPTLPELRILDGEGRSIAEIGGIPSASEVAEFLHRAARIAR